LFEEQKQQFGEPDGTFRDMTYEELRDLPVLDSVIRETLRVHPPIHSIMRKVKDDVVVPPALASPSDKNADKTYVVPSGHYVLASPLMSQMDPLVWKNADEWIPARWSDPEGVAAQAFKEYTDEHGEKIDFGECFRYGVHSLTDRSFTGFGQVSKGTDSPYQPFGAGRHRCIGEQFAYLQLGMVIATIIRRVELRLPHKLPDHNYHVRSGCLARLDPLTPTQTMITMPTNPRKVCYRRRQLD
jgi:sterol 14-demethylase